MLDNNKNKLLKKYILGCVIICSLGFLYFLFVNFFGFGIPCPIHLITGIKCPGCGITTMFIAIANCDFKAAFNANPLTFSLIPFFIFLFVYLTFKYFQHGYLKTGKWLNYILFFIIGLYIIFGIVRNLPFWPF